MVARFVGQLRGKQHNKEAPEDFMNQYSVGDYRVDSNDVDGSLDLIGIATK